MSQNDKIKVLVTGATGFIGRHVLNTLSERGVFDVHAITSKDIPHNKIANCSWHVANLLESAQINALFHAVQPTHLMHFAWYTVHGKYWTSSENPRWVKASEDLVRAFLDQGGERAVFAGTCAEYDWSYGCCSEELTPAEPASLYGRCKNDLRQIVEKLSEEAGLSSAWGRIFFLYGPGEARGRLIPSVITSLLQDKPARCTHGNQIRDFMYVEDVASAFVSLLESEVQSTVNIASGWPTSLRVMICNVADLLGKRDLVEFGALPVPPSEPLVLLADVRKLNQEVGWKPRLSLETGLERTVEWWKKSRTYFLR